MKNKLKRLMSNPDFIVATLLICILIITLSVTGIFPKDNIAEEIAEDVASDILGVEVKVNDK